MVNKEELIRPVLSEVFFILSIFLIISLLLFFSRLYDYRKYKNNLIKTKVNVREKKKVKKKTLQ